MVAGSAAMGVTVILLLTMRYGVGVTPDSVQYIAAARSLASGDGFVGYDGREITSWPPIYSTLLALAQIGVNSDLLQLARFINALLFGLIILLSIIFTTSMLPTDGKSIILAALLVLLAPPLQQVSATAWSEPLFIALVLVFLFNLQSFLKNGAATRFSNMVIIAAVTPLVRYIGASLIITGVISIFLMPQRIWVNRWKSAIPFGLLASLPLLAWMARNFSLSDTLMGHRSSATVSLAQIVNQTAGLLFVWLLPWILVLAILLVLARYSNVGRRGYFERFERSRHQLVPLIVFTVVYISMLLYSESATELNEVDNRYVSPVFVPLILLALFLVSVTLEQLRGRLASRNYNLLVFSSSVFLISYSLVITGLVDISFLRFGVGGFGTKLWHDSELVQYIRSNPDIQQHSIYTNGPDVTYLLFDLETEPVPVRSRGESPDGEDLLSSMRRAWPPNDGYLIWYDNIEREYLFTVEDLRQISTIEPVASLSDGSVFRVYAVD